jgi:C4-dicarboxylate-specific signal transduction histidine kinase
LLSATVVVAIDHFARGVFWPQSVFGVLTASHWRWVEHAGWVIFEDIFLMYSIQQSVREMHLISERQAGLETVNQGIEQLVQERTSELEQSKKELEQNQKQLVETSRQAGMAEVATSVLHNVGNVLNSINVSTSVVSDRLKKSKVGNITKIAALMKEHAADLGNFITTDAKGRQLPAYLEQLAGHLAEEQATMLEEISSLGKNVDHVKDIVAMQQSYAKVSGVTEAIKVTDLVEDALRMNASALIRHDVHFFREYDEHLPEITVEKHKVLQILVNLIRNAKQACDESGQEEKRLTMRVTNGSDMVRIALIDNGIGIPAEHLPRIFNHGFTTKKEGHGFGLHSGILAAKEMGGSLSVHSDGPGKGATFTLALPCEPKQTENTERFRR